MRSGKSGLPSKVSICSLTRRRIKSEELTEWTPSRNFPSNRSPSSSAMKSWKSASLPHNGKEADFQLFMALLDGERFEGKFRDGVHSVNSSDLMRRLVKEQMLTFDGKPLFPERIAYTVNYNLSDAEADLYKQV